MNEPDIFALLFPFDGPKAVLEGNNLRSRFEIQTYVNGIALGFNARMAGDRMGRMGALERLEMTEYLYAALNYDGWGST